MAYKEFLSKGNSDVWQYFLRSEDGQSAKCKHKDCQKVLRTGGGSTKGLHTHLLTVHKNKVGSPSISVRTKSLEVESSTNEKNKSITDYFPITDNKKLSLGATLARLTALDGIPFYVICNSSDLRAALEAMGFKNLPQSANTMRKIVLEYSKNVRISIISELYKKKISGQRFSLSFDEWTSQRNSRYLNIIVHGQHFNFWSLGLARINGTLPAEKCIQLLEEKLEKHKLNLHRDIVAIITDGASIMKKVGRIINIDKRLCFAHGVQYILKYYIRSL